jgi:phosphoenolpyruvate synthase/pyruvate phosphate dikinase
MNWILSPSEVDRNDRRRIGGKGYALARLLANGFTIPETLCLTVDAYNEFVGRTGLRERILLELARISKRCAGKKSGIVPHEFAICF